MNQQHELCLIQTKDNFERLLQKNTCNLYINRQKINKRFAKLYEKFETNLLQTLSSNAFKLSNYA